MRPITTSRSVLDALKARPVCLAARLGREIHLSMTTVLGSFNVKVRAQASRDGTALAPIGAVDSRRTIDLVLDHQAPVKGCGAVSIGGTTR